MINVVKKDRSRLTAAAMGRRSCDLSIENAKLVNVFTGEIYDAAVDILDGVVVRIRERGEIPQIRSASVIDAGGRYLVPGFVDTHLHVESSLMVPENFGKAVCVWGTTTVVADPHEIANVLGVRGVEYMLKSGKDQPIRLFQLAPSCIPSLPGLEESGAVFGAEEISHLLDEEGIMGIGEVMDYYGVSDDDKRMHDIIAEGDKRGCFIQGHAPTFTGDRLCSYICGGPVSDHECKGFDELYAKRRMGMYIDLRVHSREQARYLLKAVEPGIFQDTVAMCTDDVNAYRLQRKGSLNRSVADLILEGLDPIRAVRCATLNGAREYGFADVGAIAPGYSADIQIVDDLTFENYPYMVLMKGQLIAQEGHYLGMPAKKAAYDLGNTINYVGITGGDDFRIPADGKASRRVMIVNKGYDEKKQYFEELTCRGGFAEFSEEKKGGLNYICVLNRYGKANKTIVLYEGFGLKKGALASSIGHDCHNICIIYADPEDAFTAVEALKACGGGVCYAEGGRVKALLELPVAGLMSDLPLDDTAYQCAEVENEIARQCGLPEFSISKLIFCTLPVFERYTPTDLGVVDGPGKQFVQYID